MRTSDELLAELKTLHPLLIDLSLGRIERLLAKLGSPERRLPPVIHIAGTNGKGSTTAFLKAMHEAAGRRVHVYTSPHLVRFAERISLAGPDGRSRPIPEVDLVRLLERVASVNAGEPITFFEITTAAAFLAFAETPADAVILEVGLGGRLDTTNVVPKPALTIITPVSMDHADKLGSTIELIAAEKAGIIKPGVPLIVSQQDERALSVILDRASQMRAPVRLWGSDFQAFEQRGRLVYQDDELLLDLPMPALLGRHQVVNAGACVAAALALPDSLPQSAIERGLVEVTWPARMQRLSGGPHNARLGADAELWLDGGHNPAGGEAIARTLADLDERAGKPVLVVAGMMGQKDASGFLKPFSGLVRKLYTVPVPTAHEPPHAAADLATIARAVGLDATAADSVAAALETIAREHSGPKRVLICGSLYLAGHVLAEHEGLEVQGN